MRQIHKKDTARFDFGDEGLQSFPPRLDMFERVGSENVILT
jgi:hypothetical protein